MCVLEHKDMMIVCGPFCAGCSALLRVEACQKCARAQAASYANRIFDAIEHGVVQGGSHCEHGLVLRARRVQQYLRPKDVQRMAAAFKEHYPRGIVVFHLVERASCVIRDGVAPTLIEPAQAVAHMISAPSLAFVVLGKGRGVASLELDFV